MPIDAFGASTGGGTGGVTQQVLDDAIAKVKTIFVPIPGGSKTVTVTHGFIGKPASIRVRNVDAVMPDIDLNVQGDYLAGTATMTFHETPPDGQYELVVIPGEPE